jgi:heme exporter protein CcmD
MNLAEFFDMGGRGAFVWGSFGAFFLLLAIEAMLVRARARRAQSTLDDQRLADVAARRSQP